MACILPVPSRFGLSLRFLAFWAVFWVTQGTKSASAADFIYVTMDNNTVVRYDVSLGDASAIAASMNVFVPTGQGLNIPRGLAFDTSGKLYVANGGNNTITRYDSLGTYIGGAPFVPSGQGLSSPRGIAFDSSGKLYASNATTSTITRYDSSGTYIGGAPFITSSQGLSDPRGIAFDSSGNLYAANTSISTITRYDSSGTYIGGAPFVPTGQGLTDSVGIAFGPAGNLYVANFSNDTITRYNSSGTYIGGAPFLTASQGVNDPIGLAFDSAGNLYVANNNVAARSISKYDPNGVLLLTWSTGTAAPRYLALAPEPSTYVLGGLATAVMALLAWVRSR